MTVGPGAASSSSTNSKVKPADVGGRAGEDSGLPFLCLRAGNWMSFGHIFGLSKCTTVDLLFPYEVTSESLQ